MPLVWIAEYSTSDSFFKENGYSLKIKKEFKSKPATVNFINNLKKSDANEKVTRMINVYAFERFQG